MGIMDDIPRLTPEMVSRKNQVLRFIQLYWCDHGIGPSISEICAAVGCVRSRAQAAVRKLAREGRIHRVPSKARGIRPAETHELALQLLQSEGWVVNPARLELIHPLPPLLDLDDGGRLVLLGGTNASLPPDRARAHGAAQAGGERNAGDGEDKRA